jgi:two-component system, NarL family, nitrate/nitrite response regulator NarL
MATEIDPTFISSHGCPPRAATSAIATLAIATRHELAGIGIQTLLQTAGHSVVARCSREDELLRSLEAYRPDIIILAENIVRQEGTETALRLRACSVRIIFMLEQRNASALKGMLDLQVEGILLSAACARSLIECVESVLQGRKWVDPELLRHLAIEHASSLTLREANIAHLVSKGLRNKEIARELHVSEGTVKMHLHHIYEKFQLGGRTQLALSIAAASAQMPVSGNETVPAREPAHLDCVAAARVVAQRKPKNLA